MTEREYGKPIRWSEDGQICFIDGWGWGLTENLTNICLGKEEDIKKSFETGELNPELRTKHRQVLMEILEYGKEQEIGQSNIGGANMERAANYGIIGHKPKAARLLTPRKKFPLRKVG